MIQAERLTQIQAARWAGYSITQFDDLDVLLQAEVMAGYLTDGRIEAVQSHRNRPKSQAAANPFMENDDG